MFAVAFAPKVTVIIACLRQVVAFAPKGIKCAAYGVTQGRGQRYGRRDGRRDGFRAGFIVINDMHNNDGGQGARGCEAPK